MRFLGESLMKALGLTIAFLALTVFLLPGLTAQEKKADDAKAEKKDAAKKDEPKKDAAKKDDAKKDAAKDPEKKEGEAKSGAKESKKLAKTDDEKVVYGQKLVTKIVSMRPEMAHEFSIEVKQVDPERIVQFQIWQQQQMANLARSPSAQAILNFQIQMRQKQATDIYSNKVVDVRAVDGIKVRSLYPPQAFDDRGNIKKWTAKQLVKLKGKSRLPGYPSDMDALKIGQTVEVYLAKTTPPIKTGPPTKLAAKSKEAKAKPKFNDEDDAVALPKNQPEVVMIVILAEPTQQP
jgi:hypothetical protein